MVSGFYSDAVPLSVRKTHRPPQTGNPPGGSQQSTTTPVAGLPRRGRTADRPWLAGAERKPDAGRTPGPRSAPAGHPVVYLPPFVCAHDEAPVRWLSLGSCLRLTHSARIAA